MKKINSTLIFAYFYLFVAFSCFGQNGQPTPSSNPSDDEVVKISTTLIQVDVTVTDKNGKIITDLKPEDFEIFENDEKQEITNFSFVSADVSTSVTENIGKKPLSISPIKREQVRRTIALVVDDLTLTFENLYYVRKSLRKFVDEQMRDGDFVAIARTGGGIGILEQFTSDRRQLYAAIEKIKLNPFGRGGPKFVIPPTAPVSGDAAIGLRDPDKEADNFRQSVIAARTIGGLTGSWDAARLS
jgi:VWFA-related protein